MGRVANTVKTQVIHIEDKKAIAHLRDFAVYLKQTGQVQFIDSVSGKIKNVLLKTPPGSTQTQIMFQDPAVFQAYQA
ncbi:hypothetical protein [Legionella gresilensis]|uniref:hypothetical protein n=1 Tax=Legionella gresilensis TaxID=91823 RepID=UPI001041B18B|nr:hypothetical protein [Legionella gresilensis]